MGFNLEGLGEAAIAALLAQPIWASVANGNVGKGQLANTPEGALPAEGVKISDIKAGGYYKRSKFGGLQVVVKPSDASNQHLYASFRHDKEGKEILSSTNTYSIELMECTREFPIPNTDKVIPAGFRMFKATAA